MHRLIQNLTRLLHYKNQQKHGRPFPDGEGRTAHLTERKRNMKKLAARSCVLLAAVSMLTFPAFAAGHDASFAAGNGKIDRFLRIFIDEGGYLQVLRGLKNTLLIAVIGLVIGIVLGTLIAAVRVMPRYKTFPKILNAICTVYVGFFRGTPIVVQLLVGYYVLLPALGLNYPALSVCIAVFGLNSGAYVSEIMRGGISSVDGGQLEAGRALGLPYPTAMLRVVIPQAVKNILPTLGNEFISLIKETSVVSFVGTLDIYVAFNAIGTNSYEFMVPYLAMALIYILLVAGATVLVKLTERRLARSDRSFASH